MWGISLFFDLPHVKKKKELFSLHAFYFQAKIRILFIEVLLLCRRRVLLLRSQCRQTPKTNEKHASTGYHVASQMATGYRYWLLLFSALSQGKVSRFIEENEESRVKAAEQSRCPFKGPASLPAPFLLLFLIFFSLFYSWEKIFFLQNMAISWGN